MSVRLRKAWSRPWTSSAHSSQRVGFYVGRDRRRHKEGLHSAAQQPKHNGRARLAGFIPLSAKVHFFLNNLEPVPLSVHATLTGRIPTTRKPIKLRLTKRSATKGGSVDSPLMILRKQR